MISKLISILEIDKVDFLQKKMNEFDPSFNLSAINLYTWKFYNSKTFYFVDDDAIYLYLLKIEKDMNEYDCHKSFENCQREITILRPLIKEKNEKNILLYYKKAIALVKNDLKNKRCFQFNFGTHKQSDLDLFKNVYDLSEFNSAYIYPIEQLKYMNGKKMQKKRNFINYFKKNYEPNSVAETYNPFKIDDILKFCSQNSLDEEAKVRNYEVEAIKEILSQSLPNGLGTTIYFKNQIIGFTYGFIVNDKYEIFIEKGDKNFKGIHQYLISKNLQINEINTPFIDRQDDLYDDNLRKSKLSYKPISIPIIYFFKAK